MGWIIAGSIFGTISLIIAIILLLPVNLHIKSGKDGEMLLYFRILFFKFGEEPNPDSIIVNELKDTFGISKFQNLQSIQKTVEEESLISAAKLFVDTLVSLFGYLFTLLSACSVTRLRLNIVAASEDAAAAAIQYGILNSIVYPIAGYVSEYARVRKRAVKVNVSCDYSVQKASVEYDIVLFARLYKVFSVIFAAEKEKLIEERPYE
ncbi:MAG: DUF2953 domain-containing protein [Ruminococcaceae bacterium]|nr:DUF2953 domain-containing protein [Oscillospiraceae bacterium]